MDDALSPDFTADLARAPAFIKPLEVFSLEKTAGEEAEEDAAASGSGLTLTPFLLLLLLRIEPLERAPPLAPPPPVLALDTEPALPMADAVFFGMTVKFKFQRDCVDQCCMCCICIICCAFSDKKNVENSAPQYRYRLEQYGGNSQCILS